MSTRETSPCASDPISLADRRVGRRTGRPADRSHSFPSPLARAIAATLLVKLCVVVAMRVFLFDGAHRPVIDASAMDRRLTVSAPR